MAVFAPSVEFLWEDYCPSLREEMAPLLERHWKEIAHYPDIPLAPDWDLYQKTHEIGALQVFTARERKDGATALGRLLGYAVFFVLPNFHHRGSLQAQQDALFIEKEHRSFGARFIEWCDKRLALMNVEIVMHQVKITHDFGPLLEHLGYKKIASIYHRRLR